MLNQDVRNEKACRKREYGGKNAEKYIKKTPNFSKAMTVLKTFLPLLSWLQNPSSVLHHLTIHFANPNSKPEWLGLMSTMPPGHITKHSSFWPFLPLPAPLCSRPGFSPHTRLRVTKLGAPGRIKTHISSPSRSSPAPSAGPKIRW